MPNSSTATAAATSSPTDAAGGNWRMLVAMALSGSIGLVVVESGQAPLTVVFFRCLIGGAALLAWLLARRAWQPLRAGDLAWLVLGGVALVANWLCLFSAYRFVSISVATVVYQTQPFMLVLLAALLQGERPGAGRLPWLALAMLGVLLSSGLGATPAGGEARHVGPAWAGIALALAAALLYALTTLATQRLRHLASAQIAVVQMAAGVLLLAPLAQPLGLRGALAVSVAGLVHTAFMYTLMYAAFQRLSAGSIAALSFVYPAVALLVDLLWFGAMPGPLQWLGMALVLLTVVAHRRGWRLRFPRPWRARSGAEG